MKFKILLFIFVCCVSSSLADIENDCTVEITNDGYTEMKWDINSLDITISDDNYDYTVDITYTNNFAIQDPTGDASTYVTFTPDEANSKITLSLSDAFKTLETDYKDKDPISAFISAQATFICNDESNVVFIRLFVQDINNNLPIFTESTYEYNLPVPLSPKLDLSSVGTTISATDIDLSNNAITFTSDSPDFELEPTLVSGKTYKASLKATKYVTYNEDYSFKIWAYDKENKTSAEPATITIKIDTDNSFSTPPTFENPLYKFDYNETEGTPSFIPSDGLTITVNTINSENTKVELDDETYFTALYNQTTNEVTLTPTGTLIPATSSSVLTFTLTVSVNEESSGTIILVSLPDDKVITVPKFSSSYYLGSYTVNPGEDDDIVKLGSEISATKNAEITLSGNDNFAIDPDNYSQLKVLKDLNETAINSGEDIFLTLTATIKDDDTDYSSEATVIIQMPTVEVIASPKFTQVYYYGEIQDDDTVKLDHEIDATSGTETVEISFDDSNDYLTIAKNSDNKWVVSRTSTALPSDSTEIIATLKAEIPDKSVDPGYATLVVPIPTTTNPAPKFSSPYYTATYKIVSGDDNDEVELQTNITVTVDDGSTPEVLLSETSDFFDISYNSKNQKCVISVKKDLPEETLTAGNDIILNIQATTNSTTEIGQTIVVITLPKEVQLKFTQALYSATYNTETDPPTVDLEKIEINQDENVKFEFTTYADNFDFNLMNDPQIIISKKLDDQVIIDNQEILLSLQASLDESTATTVIQLTLPHVETQETLKFDKPSYTFSYITDPVSLTGDNITITNGKSGLSVVISDGQYADHFSVKLNDDDTCSLSVETNLEQTVLDTEVDILLTLKASVVGDDDGYATVLINLPKKQAADSAKFSQVSYLGNYVLGDETGETRVDSVTISPGISLLNDVSATVDFTETSKNFELVESDGSYTIQVVKNLDDSVLIEEASIVLSLRATVANADDGLATVVIELPKEIAPPSFTQAVYQAEYKTGTDTDTVTLSSDIEQTGSYLSESHIELITPDDYKTNFKLSESAPYEITVEEKLGTDVLQSQQEIILTLQATLDGSSLTTTSIVVVQLPEIPAAPKFIKPLYTAKYESGTVTVDDPQILTDASDQNSVTISLETYSENFEVKYDDSKKSFQFTVSEELDDSDSEIYVILDATIDGAIDHNTATVAIRMAEKTENVIPEFSKSYYEATYNHTDGSTDTITMGVDPITITSYHASETTVKVIGTYQANFDIELSDDSWVLTPLTPLDSETLNGYEIIVELEASLTDSSKTGKAVVVVNLQNSDKLDAAPRFNKALYEAEYTTDGSINLSETISIISNREESVIVTLTSFDTNFLITRDSDKKIWNLTQGDPLTDEDLKTNKELTIVLNAHLDNSVADGSATLKVTLPEQTLEFNQAYYHATYLEDNSLKVDETISVTKGAKVEIISDYGDSFAITCDETCTLTVETELSTEVLASETEIILVLQASRSDIAETSEATVIIALPLQESAKAPEFTQAIYVAVFNEDETITIQDPQIQINGLTDITEVTVTLDGTYKDYFNIIPKTDHWELTDNKLPKDVIDEEISIQLTLVATKTDVSVPGKTAVVIQLPKKTTTDVIHFASNAYLADYNQETKELTFTNDIIVEGDDDGTATITLSGENSDLFSTTYADSKVTLKVIDEIPQEIINSNIAISIDIIAKKDSATATTTVVIRLPQTETDALSFAEVTYVASYKEVDGDANDEVELENGPIQINGETDVTKIELTIEDSDFQKYFSLTPETDHWTINVDDDYPTDGDEVSLLLTLLATKDTTQGKVGVVIKLPRKETTKSFNFNQHVYTGDYMIENEEGKLTVDETITIIADVLDDISIELAGDYKEYFKQTYDSGVVTIESDGNLPDDVVNDQVAVTVNIIATRNDETDSATLVVTLPKKLTPTSIYFKNNIYLADYKIEDNNPKFTLQNQISLEGGADDVKLTLSGDYEDNFDVKYSDGTISMTLSKALDNDVIDSETAITLDIIAELKDETTKTSVVVKLPKADSDSSDDKTGLIAAVSVLAVLLVAALVGSAVFYYFKFRRSNDYSNMEDSRPSERFRKNSQTEGKHKIEHPTRRATGIVKYPLGEVVDETPDGESDFNLEKRKSVQFDTINVDELKIEKTDDVESDFDHLDVEGDTGGDADERRSSRV